MEGPGRRENELGNAFLAQARCTYAGWARTIASLRSLTYTGR